MAITLNLAGTGFVFSRNRRASSPTFQANRYKIKAGMAQKIGIGDAVMTDTVNLGYIIPVTAVSPAKFLGVFAGVLPYFDQNFQSIQFGGPFGNYIPSANPQNDIDCYVIDDPDALFRVQVSGGPWLQSWRGKNIDFLASSLANPGINGVSTAVVDGTTVANTNTLPWRINEIVSVFPSGAVASGNLGISEGGGAQDPQIINPWIEVSINPGVSELLNATGV